MALTARGHAALSTHKCHTTTLPVLVSWRKPGVHCMRPAPNADDKMSKKVIRSCTRRHVCYAAGGGEVYEGMYGPWSIEPEDIAEVMSYRYGLTATVAAFVAASLICSTAGDDGSSAAAWALNPLAVIGAAGLGVSLVQIHIYVTPLKRALQVLWALGVAGGCYLAISHSEQPLPLLVAQQPWTTWLVGPAAAAVTGVAIKEGICYGKGEAAGLALLLPLLCLTHLSGLAPAQLEQLLLVAVCGMGGVFAGRKYTQPIKDDIGDKSVFMHMKEVAGQQQ